MKKIDDITIQFEDREEVRNILGALEYWLAGPHNNQSDVRKLADVLKKMSSANFWRRQNKNKTMF